MPALDFVVVGGQKCGTTTLFELMSRHPQIVLPADKEAPIFHTEISTVEADRFLADTFAGRERDGASLGKVTPHYLIAPEAAARLHRHSPDAKIIVLVRDPVQRALSAHRMLTRRQREDLPPEEAFRAELASSRPSGGPPIHPRSYLSNGRWKSLIERYTERFESVTVHTLSDLKESPGAVLDDLYEVLDLSPHVPSNLGVAYNVTAAHRPWLDRAGRKLASGPLRPLWQRVPDRRRREIAFRFETLGRSSAPGASATGPEAVDGVQTPVLSEELMEMLRDLYRDDIEYLADQFGVTADRLTI